MVLNLLARWRGKTAAPAPEPFTAAIAPDSTVYGVGDIHGRLDLLERLLERVEADAAEIGEATAPIVLVGDYVDRGEQSRAVLERLRTLRDAAPDRLICLKGNHEAMMLQFIGGPAHRRTRWMRVGGLQTLASFGVGGVSESSGEAELEDAAKRLADALGDLADWVDALPLTARFGNVHFVHAAADPDLPLDAQEPGTLLWGHGAFAERSRRDGQWVVHGHTVTDAAEARDGRISIDTGAWFSGRLTAVRLRPGEAEFLST